MFVADNLVLCSLLLVDVDDSLVELGDLVRANGVILAPSLPGRSRRC